MKKKIFFTLIFLGLLKCDNTFALSSLMYKQAEEYYRQGMREKEMGNFAEAKKYLQKAVAINPALREAHMQLANLYAREGRDVEAEKFYRKTGEIIPSEEIEFVEHKEGKILRELPFSECPECEKREIFKEAKEWETELIEAEGEKKEIFLKESGALEGRYTGIVQRDLYKAQRKGPTIVSKLDPYHPEHKDFKIPYYKDREGLKLTPIVGVRGEYNYEKQLVGIESLLQEAQEFNQRDTEQAKRYISLNRKRWHLEEIVLHYKETWPKFTYTYMEERAVREYDAKTIWSTNNLYYDDYNRRFYLLEHTLPCIKRLGALKWKLRYGDNTSYRPNDPAGYNSFNSYLVGIEVWPYFSFIDKTVGIRSDYQYSEGEYKRAMEQGWDERKYREHQYWGELDIYYPEKFLRIKPHFYYERERHYPSYNTWYKRENGIKIEKDFNGLIRFVSDWVYIDYTRDKDPYLSGANHLTTSAWKWENGLEYEFIRDLKLKLGFDYGNGLGFDAFDYYTLRAELQWKKPGLNDFRIGYGHTNYFELDDSVDTFLFKLGLFI